MIMLKNFIDEDDTKFTPNTGEYGYNVYCP